MTYDPYHDGQDRVGMVSLMRRGLKLNCSLERTKIRIEVGMVALMRRGLKLRSQPDARALTAMGWNGSPDEKGIETDQRRVLFV